MSRSTSASAGTRSRDAEVAPGDIDEIFLGTFNGGFTRQEFPSSLVLALDPALRFKRTTRVENACAIGSGRHPPGLQRDHVAKRARIAFIVGAEKMTELAGPAVGDILIRAAYLREEGAIAGGFAGVFGRIAESYYQRHGDAGDALARIAAKNHHNGAVNPLAQLQKDLGYEFCRTVSDKNPLVGGPLQGAGPTARSCSTAPRPWCWRMSRRPSPAPRRWCSARPSRSTTICR